MSPTQLEVTKNHILHSRPYSLAGDISALALQFAIAGYIDVSSRLISKLNSHALYQRKHNFPASKHLDRLWILWSQIDSWPEGERELVIEKMKADASEADVDASAANIKAFVSQLQQKWKNEWNSRERVNEKDRLAKGPYRSGVAMPPSYPGLADDATVAEKMEAVECIVEAVKGSYFEHDRSFTYKIGAVVAALDLRLELGSERDGVGEPTPETILRVSMEMLERTKKDGWYMMDFLQRLAESERAWDIFRAGALREVVGVDTAKADVYIQTIEAAIDQRIAKGPARLPDLSMREILETIDKNNRENPAAREYWMDMNDDEYEVPSLFRDAATTEQIHQLEERLGIKLPDDYKEFLGLSNGFGQAFSGIISEAPLHSSKDVRKIGEDEHYFVDLFLKTPPEEIFNDTLYKDNGTGKSDMQKWTKVRSAIEIGQWDIDNTWLLPPSRITETRAKVAEVLASSDFSDEVKLAITQDIEHFAGSMEAFEKVSWLCVTWASGGAVQMAVYPSFTTYLRKVAEEGGKNSRLWLEKEYFGFACRKDGEDRCVDERQSGD